MRAGKITIASEAQEQITLAGWLDWHGVLYTATANGARTSWKQAVKLKRSGVKAGCPDILIFTPPPLRLGVGGVAIEVKRKKGGVVSPEQRCWLHALEKAGWVALVAYGAAHAIEQLEALGYGQRQPGRDRSAQP